MEPQRGSTGIALLFNLSARRKVWSLKPQEIDPVTTVQEVG